MNIKIKLHLMPWELDNTILLDMKERENLTGVLALKLALKFNHYDLIF